MPQSNSTVLELYELDENEIDQLANVFEFNFDLFTTEPTQRSIELIENMLVCLILLRRNLIYLKDKEENAYE